jgi:hypothetical protein
MSARSGDSRGALSPAEISYIFSTWPWYFGTIGAALLAAGGNIHSQMSFTRALTVDDIKKFDSYFLNVGPD